MVNKWLLIAAFVATVAISLHVYTFEVWNLAQVLQNALHCGQMLPQFSIRRAEGCEGFLPDRVALLHGQSPADHHCQHPGGHRYFGPLRHAADLLSHCVLDFDLRGDLFHRCIAPGTRRLLHQEYVAGIPVGLCGADSLLHVSGNQVSGVVG